MALKDRIITLGLYIQAIFYLFAGINHFLNPDFYLPLIPDYFPQQDILNTLSGIIEISFSFGLIFNKSRKWAVYGIILMLLAFIPSHVYFIQIGSCVPDSLCTPEWVAWARLVIIHPLLMLWAWNYRGFSK
ncbi:DoxX family protein [Algoriphagus limi]|uniref:DoxX-like family protein n=1 Tax=Algoriphagus limi TaxID=2975273 RepID=A0ABT2G2Y3_9BACT|nr:hypothetical protein [Algoriphagus limi]MCS5489539.1 hypothetical protein [Algoriphagus limi]